MDVMSKDGISPLMSLLSFFPLFFFFFRVSNITSRCLICPDPSHHPGYVHLFHMLARSGGTRCLSIVCNDSVCESEVRRSGAS